MVRLRSIEAEIEAPPVLVVPAGAKSAALDVRVTLRNTGEDNVVVHAPSSDSRHFWHVFDRNHREVGRVKRRGRGKAPVAGVESYSSETIAAGHEEHASRQLELDPKRLKDGQVYTVRAEFYGHVAEAHFAVATAPAPPRKAKKKAGKRKGATAKKQTARRKKKK